MAIDHASPGQVVDIGPLGSALSAHQSTALFKSTDLEVLRLVLPAGASLPQHKVRGEITIQCIEGRIDVSAGGANHVLRAGQLLYLGGHAVHAVTAIEDASALVTIALRK